MSKVYANEILLGVKLVFRNFRGLERRNSAGRTMNASGKRNFNVQLNEEQYHDLKKKGWGVRSWETTDGEVMYLLKVNLGWSDNGRGPMIKVCPTDGTKGVMLDEESVGQLDVQQVDSADLVIRPYNWDDSDEPNASAWLRSMKVYVYVDPLEAEFMSEMDDEEMPFE